MEHNSKIKTVSMQKYLKYYKNDEGIVGCMLVLRGVKIPTQALNIHTGWPLLY
jgi:hypothetical protein